MFQFKIPLARRNIQLALYLVSLYAMIDIINEIFALIHRKMLYRKQESFIYT